MIKGLVVVIIIATISIWPVFVRPNKIADVGTDGVLIAWIIKQDEKNVLGLLRGDNGSLRQLFNGNIFYPYKNVLGYSDLFFLSSLVGLITRGRVMWVGQVMTMGLVYLWWYKMTGKSSAAAIGAVALGLSRIRWEYQVHLQMWSMQWWLGAVFLWWLWCKEKKPWQWIGAGVLLGLQVWESLLPVFFAGAAMGMIFIFNRDKGDVQRLVKTGLGMLIIGTLIAGPVLVMYGKVAREFNYQRSIREAANFGMSVNELVSKFASPGLYLLLGIALLRISERVKDKNLGWLAAVAIIGVVMALGPVLKLEGKTVKIANKIPIPLPYAEAYYLVPGFGALRTPSRWMWVAAWAGSGIIAVGLAKVGKDKRKYLIGLVGTAGLAIIGGSGARGWVALPTGEQMPVVYKWLTKQSGKIVMELPAGNEHIEKWRMWYSLYHGKTLVNGFSGFTPPEWEEKLVKLNAKCVSPEDTGWMKERKIDYILIHFDQWPEGRQKCGSWLAEEKGKIVWQDEKTVVVAR